METEVRDDEFIESFVTAEEASAFELGLTWGDEPQFTVVRRVQAEGRIQVIFAYAEDI